MWLLFHHYTFPPGSSAWKFRSWRDVQRLPGTAQRGRWWSWTVCGNKLHDSRRLLRGTTFSDAQLSVRFSSFHTLSFFQDLTAAALGKKKQKQKTKKLLCIKQSPVS